jgi:hypothetical protein
MLRTLAAPRFPPPWNWALGIAFFIMVALLILGLFVRKG